MSERTTQRAKWTDENGVPNPGTPEAGAQGCICPVIDNWRGNPEIGRIRGFIMVVGCPLHHLSEKSDTPGSTPAKCACGWSGVPIDGHCASCRAAVEPGDDLTIAEARDRP